MNPMLETAIDLVAMIRENEGMSSAAYGVGDRLSGAAYAEAADEQRKRLIALLTALKV